MVFLTLSDFDYILPKSDYFRIEIEQGGMATAMPAFVAKIRLF